MVKITKCLNEWNATIEALGKGKQSILIRKYDTEKKDFLLYPTFSYALKDGYLSSFQNSNAPFVKKNVLPKKEGKKIEVKYFAKIEKIIKKPYSKIGSLRKYIIWTPEHVKSYLNGEKAHVWILRVYKLEKPVMLERTRGIKFSNTIKPVSLGGIEPVINDNNFAKIVKEIENKR